VNGLCELANGHGSGLIPTHRDEFFFFFGFENFMHLPGVFLVSAGWHLPHGKDCEKGGTLYAFLVFFSCSRQVLLHPWAVGSSLWFSSWEWRRVLLEGRRLSHDEAIRLLGLMTAKLW
jgi:hypothetical protein